MPSMFDPAGPYPVGPDTIVDPGRAQQGPRKPAGYEWLPDETGNPLWDRLAYQDAWEKSAGGQRYNDLLDQDRAFRLKQAEREYKGKLAALALQRDQLALQVGKTRADLWFRQQEMKIAQQARDDDRLKFILSTATQLRGPSNVFQYIDFMEGAKGLQPQSGFLQNLAQGKMAPAMTFGGGQTEGASPGSVARDFMGAYSESAMAQRRQNDLNLGDKILRDPTGLNPQALESLGDYRMGELESIAGKKGHDFGTFLTGYKRGKIGSTGRL